MIGMKMDSDTPGPSFPRRRESIPGHCLRSGHDGKAATHFHPLVCGFKPAWGIPDDRIPTHPGEILSEEFLRPIGVTQAKLSQHIGVPVQRVAELADGRRGEGVTPEMALLLGQAFDTSPEFWLNLQSAHDLARAKHPTKRVGKLAAVVASSS